MTPPAVGSGTLRRLNELGSGGRPVLSVYLDLDHARLPTRAAREAELEVLLAGVASPASDADAGRVREMLQSMPALVYGVRGLALFSSAEGSVSEVVALPGPVEPMAVADTIPWLEPLAGMFTSGDWGVAVIAPAAARLLRGGPRTLVEFAVVNHELPDTGAAGERSQAGCPRPVGDDLVEHARRVGCLLLRAHRRRAFDRLMVVARSELWPPLEGSLASGLRDRLVGVAELDLEAAPAQEILRTLAPMADRARSRRARRLRQERAHDPGQSGVGARADRHDLPTFERGWRPMVGAAVEGSGGLR
jgi:hypothetical protein